ncbi:MAG: CvpA family protein [Pseudomonadota bacterium]
MSLFDYVLLAILALSLCLGLWRGVVGEMIALAAWVLAFFAAKLWAAEFASSLLHSIGDPALRIVASWVIIFIVVLMLMALLRLALRGVLQALGLSLLDRLLGALFGLARGLLIVLLLIAVGGMSKLHESAWWRAAQLTAPLETAVLASKPWLPTEVAKRIRF